SAVGDVVSDVPLALDDSTLTVCVNVPGVPTYSDPTSLIVAVIVCVPALRLLTGVAVATPALLVSKVPSCTPSMSNRMFTLAGGGVVAQNVAAVPTAEGLAVEWTVVVIGSGYTVSVNAWVVNWPALFCALMVIG